MEHLFNARLDINGKPVEYDVFFDKDLYHFHPTGGNQAPRIHFNRSEDAWHADYEVEESVRNQALEQLETYLLSQH